jgi:hypothetical protein
MNDLIIGLGVAAMVTAIIVSVFKPEPQPKQEVMLCGTPRIGLHYVEDYVVDKGYVIDMKSGGVWGVNFCRAYKGEMEQ